MAVITIPEALSRLHRYCDDSGSGYYLRKRLSDMKLYTGECRIS